MKRTITSKHRNSTTKGGRWSAAVLIGFALIISACSSGTAASPEPTSPDTTVATETTTSSTPSITPPTIPPTNPPTTAAAPTTTVEPSSETEPAVDGVEEYLDQLENNGFEGVVSFRDGDDVTTRAYGIADRENDIPIDPETVFDIGSLTKQFTAAAIMRLEMDGLVSVDDQLGKHVPGLPDDKAALTLHQLLTHTAGLPVAIGHDDEPIGRTDYLRRVGWTPLEHEPGSQYVYSNVGYSLLAAVVEFASGEPYEAYLRTAVLEPAGMLDTGYVLTDWDDHTIAVGYRDPSGARFGRPNEQPWDVDGPYWNLHGNGGLLSTAADMLAWDEALAGDDVLDADAKAKLFTPHIPLDSEVGYGYGWNVIPTPAGVVTFHGGTNLIFYAELVRFADQNVAVFMVTNSLESDDENVAFDLAGQVLNHSFPGLFDD